MNIFKIEVNSTHKNFQFFFYSYQPTSLTTSGVRQGDKILASLKIPSGYFSSCLKLKFEFICIWAQTCLNNETNLVKHDSLNTYSSKLIYKSFKETFSNVYKCFQVWDMRDRRLPRQQVLKPRQHHPHRPIVDFCSVY